MNLHNNLSRLPRPRHIAFVGSVQAESAIPACQRAGYDTGKVLSLVSPRGLTGVDVYGMISADRIQ